MTKPDLSPSAYRVAIETLAFQLFNYDYPTNSWRLADNNTRTLYRRLAYSLSKEQFDYDNPA